MIIDKEAQEKIANITQRDLDEGLLGVGTADQILQALQELGYRKLPQEYRQCPECSSIWVCWNWLQSEDKKFWYHECWDCGNCSETVDKVEDGVPYDFLRAQDRPRL